MLIPQIIKLKENHKIFIFSFKTIMIDSFSIIRYRIEKIIYAIQLPYGFEYNVAYKGFVKIKELN